MPLEKQAALAAKNALASLSILVFPVGGSHGS